MKLFKGLMVALILALGVGSAFAAGVSSTTVDKPSTENGATTDNWCPPLC